MSDRCATPMLEARVLAAFHQACAERALEVADGLLSILELIARQRDGELDPDGALEEPALGDAYLAIAAAVRRPREH
ncbi:hypothetical protein [Tistrella mobilis]|uniref:Uncharacterized protein n=1 Tax=Tistrella mobilis (strain KA081020-065) TaxID=1110502 RepID=I3TMU3_TISMK|nr:hypothetical protein [Tistrella mobilis]AFK54081.1 hypothetical protein TMO_2243 [Tistrella mobilis KA081020-065]